MKTLVAIIVSFLLGISSLQAQWTNYSSVLFPNSIMWSVQVLDANNVWAISKSSDVVVKTTNGGLTWTALPINDPAFSDFSLESISVKDANTAWAVGYNFMASPIKSRIYKTTDGGISWQPQISPYDIAGPDDHWVRANHFFDSQNGVTLGEKKAPNVPGSPMSPHTFEVLTTSDGGATWNLVPPANQPGGTHVHKGIYYRSFAVVNNIIWFLSIDNWLYKSTDKGVTWTATNTGLPQSLGYIYLSVAFSDANNGLVATEGTLRRTIDGGATWTTLSPTGTWYAGEIIAVPGTTSTYISSHRVNSNKGSSISYDGGNTWVSLEATNMHFDMHFINPTTGWSAGYGNLMKFNITTLGTSKEICNNSSYFIYPNPGNGIFQIAPANTDAFVLEVYDLTGKKVMQQEGNRFGKNTLDLSSYKKGVYMLHILSGERRIIEKIVLQ